MEAKHSPLPWRQHSGDGKTYASVRSHWGQCVADCGSRSDNMAQANAELIVRAVNCHDELVAALKAVEPLVSFLHADYMQRNPNNSHAAEIEALRAVLAKAEGGAS